MLKKLDDPKTLHMCTCTQYQQCEKKKKIEEVNKKSNVGSLLTGCFKILLYHYKVK